MEYLFQIILLQIYIIEYQLSSIGLLRIAKTLDIDTHEIYDCGDNGCLQVSKHPETHLFLLRYQQRSTIHGQTRNHASVRRRTGSQGYRKGWHLPLRRF